MINYKSACEAGGASYERLFLEPVVPIYGNVVGSGRAAKTWMVLDLPSDDLEIAPIEVDV